MLKMQLNISGYKNIVTDCPSCHCEHPQGARQSPGRNRNCFAEFILGGKARLLHFVRNDKSKELAMTIPIAVFVLLLLTASCAPKYIERPSYEGVSLDRALAEYRDISSIEAALSVEYEKNDSIMSGDAFLNLSENKLNLRIYYLGFLAGEVTEEDGVIKSKPKFDKNKSIVLVDGLKNSFFWWTLKDYSVQEKDGMYVLKNYNRKILVSKETLLPVLQTIELDNGEEMHISYDEPVQHSGSKQQAGNEKTENAPLPLWYQSRLLIQYRNYLVRVKVKSYSVAKQKNS